ncbi:MAG: hydrogenase maturation protease [Deltaproteobacteria bacterium]|nr:hydrogenase maturation protease [Deltaproteobacteria bacterium]
MKILVAGIGNIFLGDDGFGVEVAQRMARRPQPEGVRVRDLGIRGFDLSFALQDGWDAVVIVDAAQRGEAPGTLYVLEPQPGTGQAPTIDLHGMDPARVLAMTRALGDATRVMIVACEPATFGDLEHDDPAMALSEPVAAAIEPAIALIGTVIARLSGGEAHA